MGGALFLQSSPYSFRSDSPCPASTLNQRVSRTDLPVITTLAKLLMLMSAHATRTAGLYLPASAKWHTVVHLTKGLHILTEVDLVRHFFRSFLRYGVCCALGFSRY